MKTGSPVRFYDLLSDLAEESLVEPELTEDDGAAVQIPGLDPRLRPMGVNTGRGKTARTGGDT